MLYRQRDHGVAAAGAANEDLAPILCVQIQQRLACNVQLLLAALKPGVHPRFQQWMVDELSFDKTKDPAVTQEAFWGGMKCAAHLQGAPEKQAQWLGWPYNLALESSAFRKYGSPSRFQAYLRAGWHPGRRLL